MPVVGLLLSNIRNTMYIAGIIALIVFFSKARKKKKNKNSTTSTTTTTRTTTTTVSRPSSAPVAKAPVAKVPEKIISTDASVVSKYSRVGHQGKMLFYAVFETLEGKRLDISVTDEQFDSICEGDMGLLKFQKDKMVAFDKFNHI